MCQFVDLTHIFYKAFKISLKYYSVCDIINSVFQSEKQHHLVVFFVLASLFQHPIRQVNLKYPNHRIPTSQVFFKSGKQLINCCNKKCNAYNTGDTMSFFAIFPISVYSV